MEKCCVCKRNVKDVRVYSKEFSKVVVVDKEDKVFCVDCFCKYMDKERSKSMINQGAICSR